jgi:hypothetical protein
MCDFTSAADPFPELAASWVIVDGAALLKGVGGFKDGALTPFFTSETEARALATELSNGVSSSSKMTVRRVQDPWQFMRLASQNGICGIERHGGRTTLAGC